MSRSLITGGAGFIGANLAARLLENGHTVTVLDDLSRATSRRNADWLDDRFGPDAYELRKLDLRDHDAVAAAVNGCDRVYHLGAQVAVTSSVADPVADFEVNATATLHLLEAVRHADSDPVVIYASTNKVYGSLDDVRAEPTRYELADLPHGVPETHPLDMRTPYGCSKGTADQYVLDYHRTYGVRSVVFRQSCIYGPRQFGLADQGWVAWLVRAAMAGDPITIFGDGRQLRDLLYIDDLLDAYDAAVAAIDHVAGEAFNIGGGPANTVSIWAEFGPLLESMLGREIPVTYDDWRPSDQRAYCSDIRKASRLLDWQPQVSPAEGIARLHAWIAENPGS